MDRAASPRGAVSRPLGAQLRRRVAVRSLGGTIAMTSTKESGARPTVTADSLVEAVPELQQHADLEATTVCNIPGASLEMSTILMLFAELERACDSGVSGVVVTQGTDTLEECAYLLDVLWSRPQPVVFTGAMRPADATGADGPANLLAAVAVAADPAATGRGTLVVMSDEIHLARSVTKSHTASVSAFVSRGTGPIGRFQEGRVLFNAPAPAPGQRAIDVDLSRPIPDVELVRLTLGQRPRRLEAIAGTCDGLVVEAFGGGHVPGWWLDPLAELARDMPVVLASRTGGGSVLTHTYDFPGSETSLLALGLISANDLDGSKARLLLAMAIMTGSERSEIDSLFRAHAVQDVGGSTNDV